MSKKSARKERFAKSHPELVGKEKAEEATGKEVTVEESTDTPTEEVVEESTEKTGSEELAGDSLTPEDGTEVKEPVTDPLDVNKDGKVDTEDILAVAEGAAEEAAAEESTPETDATPDTAEAANTGASEEE